MSSFGTIFNSFSVFTGFFVSESIGGNNFSGRLGIMLYQYFGKSSSDRYIFDWFIIICIILEYSFIYLSFRRRAEADCTQRSRVCDGCWLYNIAKRYSRQIWGEACGGTEQAVAAYAVLYDVH